MKRMLEEDRNCYYLDLLKQSYALRKAPEKLEGLNHEGHPPARVVEAIRLDNAPPIIDQLLQLYTRANR